MKERALLIIAFSLAAGALGHSIWLQQKFDRLAASASIMNETARPLNAATSREQLSVEELSMRFTHAELYESREEVPKDIALEEFRRRGLLKRGVSAFEIRSLLGKPPETTERQTDEDSPNLLWHYSMLCSSFSIEFDPEGTAVKFSQSFESDRPDTQRIDVW